MSSIKDKKNTDKKNTDKSINKDTIERYPIVLGNLKKPEQGITKRITIQSQ